MEKMALSLVGKVLSNEKVNKTAFMGLIGGIWKVKEEVEIKFIQSNVCTFHFKSVDDRTHVLARGPWTFDVDLIMLVEPSSKGDIENMNFSRNEFWVQIHRVPLLCMTTEIGWFLWNLVGDVSDVDAGINGDCSGIFLRVCVKIDV
ncbi:hypothetical protein Dsin_013956 [Dipteronia sinensis]|uniref:DUF4283 domain-containing protein n=1 Tax=Dipteronia sinensis TaxID=43782 RepID=A0AAE0AKU4_9ROSI|nr:hypothetical protein Dsin_013956 [Dipteronia sinensis]